MIVMRTGEHCRAALAWGMFAAIGSLWLSAQAATPVSAPAPPVPGHFVDITAQSGVHFLHQAPHTSRKYLLETMGSGVALFDCDGDGRLDVFLVNGAPYPDPTPKLGRHSGSSHLRGSSIDPQGTQLCHVDEVLTSSVGADQQQIRRVPISRARTRITPISRIGSTLRHFPVDLVRDRSAQGLK